jgi:rSAM/selenodomain-associated transferase 2
MDVAIIIPALNEADQLAARLPLLQALRSRCRVLLVDGGSEDGTAVVAEPLVDRVLHSQRGRAKQMNYGAARAQADVLLFLHADTALPDNAVERIVQAVADGYLWGRFDVGFDNMQPIFKLIALMMNLRSRVSGIATGDQALFVTRSAFQAVGGYPDIALMEDIAISARLKKLGKQCCLSDKVITSARRWQQHGVFSTILLMWRLRLSYFFGADPDDLAARYYRRR